jgi:uncharacterized membrane protein YecN with MAPEG domain
MSSDQRQVVIGVASATGVSVAFIGLGYFYFPWTLPPLATIGERLAFTLQCDLFALLMLLFGIACVANQRFFSPEAIDGSRGRPGSSLDINRRYVQNTVEQLMLLFVGHLVLATLVSEAGLKIIPVLVVFFIVARLSFWIGYHHSPVSRAFGFAATFYPTLAVLLYDIYRLLRR